MIDRREVVRQAAALLYSRGARHVWIFGGLAMGRQTDAVSDIDLAIDGLPPRQFEPTYRALRQMCRCKVDLVEMETATPAMRDHVLRVRVLVPRGE